MPPDKPDFSEFVRLHAEVLAMRNRLAQQYLPGLPPPKPGTCPEDLDAMCKALDEWFKQFYLWALKIEDKLPGGPGDLPPPPPPPFG